MIHLRYTQKRLACWKVVSTAVGKVHLRRSEEAEVAASGKATALSDGSGSQESESGELGGVGQHVVEANREVEGPKVQHRVCHFFSLAGGEVGGLVRLLEW